MSGLKFFFTVPIPYACHSYLILLQNDKTGVTSSTNFWWQLRQERWNWLSCCISSYCRLISLSYESPFFVKTFLKRHSFLPRVHVIQLLIILQACQW